MGTDEANVGREAENDGWLGPQDPAKAGGRLTQFTQGGHVLFMNKKVEAEGEE